MKDARVLGSQWLARRQPRATSLAALADRNVTDRFYIWTRE